ncbi:hypothetical protein GCM10028807_23520 [Spirosoma daeguense]
MKKILLLSLFLFSLKASLYAQDNGDVIYTANGNRLDRAQITDLTEDRVVFKMKQENGTITRSLLRQNVLVAFRTGNFLVIDKLSADLSQAKQQLQTFLTTAAWQGKDYLLKAVPFEIIPAKISYESDVIVNYINNKSQSASIPKGELIAIFRNDGGHNFLRVTNEGSSMLGEVGKPIGITQSQMVSSATETPIPSEPTPGSVSKAPPVDTQPANTPQGKKVTLSDADYQYYRKKALEKVDKFASYLNVITDKSQSSYVRDQAINQAASLFMPAATIEVSSTKRPGVRKFQIRTYLNNLKLLPYSSTQIEWSEIQYLKELSQAMDGNYYGIITAQQTFIGRGRDAFYSDVTPKNVRVKLEQYHLTKDGKDDVKWNLLLGSIGISAQ